MKRMIKSILAAAVLALAFVSTADAQPGRRFYVDAGWQFNGLAGNDFIKDASGWGAYAEGGYRRGAVYAYLKGGLFRVDNWSDRIYAYERDAPGNFSVPAYYGRGFWVSAVAGVKVSRWGKMYFRASYTGYPWLSPSQEKKKPGKAELKVQMAFNL